MARRAGTTTTINILPDELIIHILSFLPTTTDRARTSLLSRRWRHLWTHHPSIHFTLRLPAALFVDDDAAAPAASYVDAASSYVSTVDACLRSYNAPSLDLLSLDLWLPTSSPSVTYVHARVADRWLRFAGLRSARRLSLTARTHPRNWFRNPCLPASLYFCRDLADLRLSFCAFPAVPSDFLGFRNLKTLSLCRNTIAGGTLADLLACCPLLVNLTILDCLGLLHVDVRSQDLPNITRLVVASSWSLTPAATIEAPNLEFFHFGGNLRELNWEGSPNMREAIIKAKAGMEFEDRNEWMTILLAVSGVSVLTVNRWFCQFVILEQGVFKNLKELNCEIDWITGSVLHALVSNIGECPMLERLCVDFNYEPRSTAKDCLQETYCKTHGIDDDSLFPDTNTLLKDVEDIHEGDEHELPEHFLESRLSLCHLRTVTLKEFLGSKNEMLLAKFLLGCAVSLEKFIVFDFLQCDETRTEEELRLLLASIPRASSHVQMKLSRCDNMTLGRFFK